MPSTEYLPTEGTPLSPIEIRIIQGIARGESRRQTAKILGRGEATICTHMRWIFRKIGDPYVRTRAALIHHLYVTKQLNYLPPEPRRRPDLTNREREILDGIALGLDNKEIARQMNLTIDQVKYSVTKMLGDFAAEDRAHLVALAHQLKILEV